MPTEWRLGDGLVGQAALERKTILYRGPRRGRARAVRARPRRDPTNVIVVPVVFEDQVLAVIELASLRPFGDINQVFLEQIVETVGVVRQHDRRHDADRGAAPAVAVARRGAPQRSPTSSSGQQRELQHTNAEIELARRELEARAEQLALSSKYKSEFLANMSHELRTPLNSLLILAKLLAENGDGNLSDRQVEFAGSIFDAGNDLLTLISRHPRPVQGRGGPDGRGGRRPSVVRALCADLEQVFRPIAEQQELTFSRRDRADEVPETFTTDEHRCSRS